MAVEAPVEKIRNVVFLGHAGAGKTTLTEAALHVAGVIPRMGRIEEDNTVSDFDPDEQKRQHSISLSVAPMTFDGFQITIIDTPGAPDFVGDAAAALHVADLAIFVVSATEGVEVQTEATWHLAEQHKIPRAIFINKLDRERASFERTLESLKSSFGNGVAPLELPIGKEANFTGVIDLLEEKAVTYENGKANEQPVPKDMEVTEHDVHDALVEGIVVADDELTERYLADETLPTSELEGALAKGIKEASVFPVLCGSAVNLVGIDRLLRFIAEEGPAPEAPSGPPVVFVFKTHVDPHVGHINYFKVLQGPLTPDTSLVNSRTVNEEKFHQLLEVRGKDRQTVQEIAAGNIGAVTKLHDVRAGDVLGLRGATIDAPEFVLPAPTLPTAIRAASRQDEDKLGTALHRLLEEDAALHMERNPETQQTLLWGMGETHLAIAIERLNRTVKVEQEPVQVPYRETITSSGEAEGRYKKQSGGHGQFGVASLRVEPLARGAGFEFVDAIVGGVIPRQFIPAVEKGVVETMANGGTLGFPVVDTKVTCFDGKHHPVDSSEQSFKMAGALAFSEAEQKAHPALLEPMRNIRIVAPEATQGEIMGDLNGRRGRIQGAQSLGNGTVEIEALVPLAEVLRYTIDLRAITGGRGEFTLKDAGYDTVPSHLVDKIRAG